MIKNTTKALAAAGAAAAAAASYYFYGSKDAKKHRKQATKWATNMKDEVVERAQVLQNIDKQALWNVIDEVTGSYQTLRSIDSGDLSRAASELRDNWQRLKDEVERRIGMSSSREESSQSRGRAKRGSKTSAKRKMTSSTR